MFRPPIRPLFALVALASALAAMATAPARAQIPHDRSSPTPAPVADKTAARALELVGELQAGKVDPTELSDSLAAIFDPVTIAGYKHQLADLGTPSKAILRFRTREDRATRYVYSIVFTGTTAYLTFAIDDDTQKISVLYLRPGPPVL
jgi:hypothetical protein